MSAKNDSKTSKSVKNTKKIENKVIKKEKTKLQKAIILQKNIKIDNKDKMLEKVEKYVDKNREKTSQEMMERKKKRPTKNFQDGDLEVMITRISAESKPKEKTKEISKIIVYIIYTIVFIAIIIFIIKYFFIGFVPQIT